MSDAASSYQPRCKNFCCKAMIVYGEAFEMDPDYQAGLSDVWCVLTSKEQGPDGGGVALEMCSDPQRSCFEEY